MLRFLNYYNTDLIPAGLELPVTQYTDEKDWTNLITASSFLPRCQLFGGNSDAVKEGKIGVGRFGLVRKKDQIEDLTNAVDILPLSWRFKAMRMVGDDVHSYYNPKSPAFNELRVLADTPNSGCTYGVEFLIWIPSAKAFATYYLNSKTSRREAPNLRDILTAKKAATLKVQLITKGKFKWHGPVVTVCSTPFEIPPAEEMVEQAQRFISQKETEIQPVAGQVNPDDQPR